jgi:hypothetical protein
MVRRGSTVRVRQRALEEASKWPLVASPLVVYEPFFSAAAVEREP